MFKNLAWYLLKDTLVSLAKALPALIILILAIWIIAGTILLPGCSHPKKLNPAPDYYLAMNVKEKL